MIDMKTIRNNYINKEKHAYPEEIYRCLLSGSIVSEGDMWVITNLSAAHEIAIIAAGD